uniref:SET domain-containing protein n=1 Tax=Chromera velia CCMP2878 TaxID=1169474 RepID=A0A0G4HJU2_9ALVE|mmetsp:Transcript_15341/g.31108  ORF Transcript_15341/g.31108 Transcript_15341/m.31108 type:complete len:750 (+) Transcript_15341:184-2433(+)|eukprot:Cvel_28279.t1-p1 / transcript=Cvel_28279.t1 / gene=Cvel_28279 / organism=Chromera_velia_CCMP2878 / gene_product=hypothetical protein / transcript_product=hypothetical protein / location=Cvel_scaffold3665:8841-11630(-) / protein_length=749 / sequence_SO=supercontig / SO=protein_coding / is_pseudo=false
MRGSRNSKSGVAGVTFHPARDYPSWVACWWEGPKQRRKHFSCNSLGNDRALQEAIAWRKAREREGKGERTSFGPETDVRKRRRLSSATRPSASLPQEANSLSSEERETRKRGRKRKETPASSPAESSPSGPSKAQQMAEIHEARKKNREDKMNLMRNLVTSLQLRNQSSDSGPKEEKAKLNVLREIANAMLRRHPSTPRSSFPLPFFRTDLTQPSLTSDVPPPPPAAIQADQANGSTPDSPMEICVDVEVMPVPTDPNEPTETEKEEDAEALSPSKKKTKKPTPPLPPWLPPWSSRSSPCLPAVFDVHSRQTSDRERQAETDMEMGGEPGEKLNANKDEQEGGAEGNPIEKEDPSRPRLKGRQIFLSASLVVSDLQSFYDENFVPSRDLAVSSELLQQIQEKSREKEGEEEKGNDEQKSGGGKNLSSLCVNTSVVVVESPVLSAYHTARQAPRGGNEGGEGTSRGGTVPVAPVPPLKGSIVSKNSGLVTTRAIPKGELRLLYYGKVRQQTASRCRDVRGFTMAIPETDIFFETGSAKGGGGLSHAVVDGSALHTGHGAAFLRYASLPPECLKEMISKFEHQPGGGWKETETSPAETGDGGKEKNGSGGGDDQGGRGGEDKEKDVKSDASPSSFSDTAIPTTAKEKDGGTDVSSDLSFAPSLLPPPNSVRVAAHLANHAPVKAANMEVITENQDLLFVTNSRDLCKGEELFFCYSQSIHDKDFFPEASDKLIFLECLRKHREHVGVGAVE